MRTLVISDLHLGNRAARDVLRRAEPLERLTEAISQIDRLVLLGDVAELATRSAERSLAVAEPVLRAIGQRLDSDREVILVPGNHDRPLVRGWARARGSRLTPAGSVPAEATPALARVVSWLAPARVRIHYPGVWLADGLYATHGHYLDRHLNPHAPVGLPRFSPAERRGTRATAWDYEQHRFRARRDDGRPHPLSSGLRLAARAVNPALPRLLMRVGLSPLTAAAVDLQMRHAALPALRLVLERLGVEADTVIFGHVHRLGPMAGDTPRDWRADGGPQILNTGSWLYERLLIDRAQPPHPYWPGGAIRIDSGQPPRVVNLLQDLEPPQL
ncbi:MAG TPA: metallophosphoesterase [Solirubrobacteraceae bacterium]